MVNAISVTAPATDALWIVDPCHYGRSGLVSLFGEAGVPVEGTPGLQCDDVLAFVNDRCLVLRLPSDPVSALVLLLRLPEVPWTLLRCHTLVVLSPFSTGCLLRLFGCLKLPCFVQVLNARLPLHLLKDAILARRKYARIGNGLGTQGLPVLSIYERRTLWESLQAVSIHTQAKKRFVSTKTVYSHRVRALAKLGHRDLSGLIGRLGGGRWSCLRIFSKHQPHTVREGRKHD